MSDTRPEPEAPRDDIQALWREVKHLREENLDLADRVETLEEEVVNLKEASCEV